MYYTIYSTPPSHLVFHFKICEVAHSFPSCIMMNTLDQRKYCFFLSLYRLQHWTHEYPIILLTIGCPCTSWNQQFSLTQYDLICLGRSEYFKLVQGDLGSFSFESIPYPEVETLYGKILIPLKTSAQRNGCLLLFFNIVIVVFFLITNNHLENIDVAISDLSLLSKELKLGNNRQ